MARTHVLGMGRRALICYGSGHLHHGGSLAGALERQTGERMYLIADVAPFPAGDPGGLAAKLARQPRNTVIPTAGTWLGSFDAGLFSPDLQGAPHGQWSWWNPAIFLDPAYWQELQRRNALTGNGVDPPPGPPRKRSKAEREQERRAEARAERLHLAGLTNAGVSIMSVVLAAAVVMLVLVLVSHH